MTAARTATSTTGRAAPPLAPDLEAAGAFLDAWVALSGVPHLSLIRIHPETRAIKANAFAWPAEREGALKWIEASNKACNVYFGVNVARPINKKAEKSDIETLVAVHADVDPLDGADFGEERERLHRLAAELAERKRPPTFILDSGGGIQAFYMLARPVPVDAPEYLDEIEDLNDRLRCVLGARDSCWNVDRIMRVPGTVNWPDKRKRDRGQVPAMARVLHASGEARHWREIMLEVTALEDEPPELASPVEHRPREYRPGEGSGVVLEGMPPYPSEAQLKALFGNHPELAAIWDKSTCMPPLDDSPSGWDQRFASALAHLGCRPEMIGSFLRAYREHHAPEKGKQDRVDYILRTVERATRDRGDEASQTADASSSDPDPEPDDDGPPFDAGTAKPNGSGGQQQTAGDANGRNRGTFGPGVKPGADWPEPGVLGEPPPAPDFPTELLPEQLRLLVEHQAENMGVPTCVLAVPLLVCIAGAIGKDAVLQVKRNDPTWTERPCLWSALIMQPGSLKTPAIKEATKPLRIAEMRQRDAWRERVREWEKRQKYKNGKLVLDPEDPKPPEPKLVVADTTIEAVADAMVHSHGLTLIRDELSGWAANMSRYSKGNDRPFFLECHSGGAYPVDRIIRGRQIVPDVYLNILGSIQPKVARRVFVAEAAGEDDGFLSRFGLICYPNPAPWRGVRDVAPATELRQLNAWTMQGLADANWRPLLAPRPEDPDHGQVLRFDGPAQARFFAWLDAHMRALERLADKPEHVFMTKGRGLVLRLAITLHVFRWKCGEVELRYVDEASLAAAIGIFERFCAPMYRRVCAAFGEVQAHDAARRIADLIKKKRLDKIRVGDVTKLHWQGLRERAPIVAAFEALEDVDWLRKPHAAAGTRGGRPADHWIVNPKVHQEGGSAR